MKLWAAFQQKRTSIRGIDASLSLLRRIKGAVKPPNLIINEDILTKLRYKNRHLEIFVRHSRIIISETVKRFYFQMNFVQEHQKRLPS
jgi:hypothetical protein